MRFELILLALLTFVCLSFAGAAETAKTPDVGETAKAADMTTKDSIETLEIADVKGTTEMATKNATESSEIAGVNGESPEVAVVGGVKAPETIALSAIEDVYLNFVEGEVHNGDILRCEIDPANKTWPVTPLIKFDLSGIDITEDSVGILVLKADSVQKGDGDGPCAIALFPTDASWTDESDFVTLSLALEPLIDALDAGDLDYARTAVRFDNDDDIFAFEVSKYLKDKTSEEVSFILVAVNDDRKYVADFRSTESGEGPHLLITTYPTSNI